MLSLLLSLPVIPSLIIACIITLCVYMIDTADPENYIDKMYYLKVFIISFLSSVVVIYCNYHMGVIDNTPASSPLKRKTLEQVDFSKLTSDVAESIQTAVEKPVSQLVADLPDF